MNREKLEAASEQGIINKEQVEALLSFFEANVNAPDGSDAEVHFRFVRSFGDIFITLGIIFVAIAGAQIDMPTYFNMIPVLILIAATEWLVRVRRLALPGIALLISTLYFFDQLIGFEFYEPTLLKTIILTVVALLFYLRYKMPFTLLPIAAGCVAILSVTLGVDIKSDHYIFAIFGLLIFLTAMWFDSHDQDRQHRFSDAGFWLHLLAAPLVVHGVMISLLTSTSIPFMEFMIILFFVVFFLIALYVDRRAILVSSLSYAIFAVINLAINQKIDMENMTLVIFIAFGMFIVFFGVYWYKIRNMIFSKTNAMKLSNYVPPFVSK